MSSINTDNVWFKIGLASLPVLGVCVTLWADVRSMKSERAQITDGRLVRLEEQQKAQGREIDELRGQIKALWQRRAAERRNEP